MENRKPIIIIGLALVVLTLVFAALMRGKQWSWRETYDVEKKDPYGAYVLAQLMENYFSNQQFEIRKDSIAEWLDEEDGNYFFLGNSMFMTDETSESLQDFVARGNQAFIFSRYLPSNLSTDLFETDCFYGYYDYDYYEDVYEEEDPLYQQYWNGFSYYMDTLVSINFTHSNLTEDTAFVFRHLQRKSKAEQRSWYYMTEDSFCETGDSLPTTLGTYMDSLVNFARVEYGDGYFYFHTMPSLFTNIHLLEEGGKKYAAKTLSHLEEAPILWDVKSKIPERGGGDGFSNLFNRRLSEDNPLQYILSQPPLAWAWYILLSLGLLYLIFRAKRRQRMIPVLERNENTSLAFVSTIGRMYFLQNNHRNLALQKMQLFLADVRDRYKISTQNLDEEFVKKLTTKSEVDVSIIEQILVMHRNIKKSAGTSENTLIEFHQLMERFWRAA
ncbi:MAG: DUF4350 domain-containing protein [Bacteroidota bacterium]